ncbi:MAG: LysR family transcriptional regulator [Lachnospiraceae bacterium]|nr:LysR family transcriptional regulator [Lachnospiraceae bacterium]
MNLISLKYFIAIAEQKSFTKAAEMLYVTQPALSKSIADLEEEFGVPLFVRSKKGIFLTEAGEQCFAEAKSIVHQCDKLVESMRLCQHNQAGSLSIGYLGSIEYNLLSNPLKYLSDAQNGGNVSLVRANLAELNQSLLTGKFDLIYTVAVGLDKISGIRYKKIARNPLKLIVSTNNELAKRDSVQVSDLEGLPFVLFERSYSPLTVDYTINMCLQHGFSPTVVHYASDPQTLLLSVSSGKGVAFLSERATYLYSAASAAYQSFAGLKILDIDDCDLDFDVVIVYKKDNKNPFLSVFLEICDRFSEL